MIILVWIIKFIKWFGEIVILSIMICPWYSENLSKSINKFRFELSRTYHIRRMAPKGDAWNIVKCLILTNKMIAFHMMMGPTDSLFNKIAKQVINFSWFMRWAWCFCMYTLCSDLQYLAHKSTLVKYIRHHKDETIYWMSMTSECPNVEELLIAEMTYWIRCRWPVSHIFRQQW